MKKSRALTALITGIMLLAIGCTRGAPSDQSGSAQKSAGAQANSNEQPISILKAKTVEGDLERATWAITGARQDLRENNWDAAAGLLRSASASIGEAIAKKPRTYSDYEDFKAAIDRALHAVETHAKDADSQVAQLEVFARSVKTNS